MGKIDAISGFCKTNMKTIREHLQDLPEPARSLALANMWWERADDRVQDPRKAIWDAFLWYRSPQGYKYWQQIYDNIL